MKKEIEAMSAPHWKQLIFAFLFLNLCLIDLQAKTFYIKENATGNGNSWTEASGDLNRILKKATFGDQVWVAGGTYFPTDNNDRTRSFCLPNGVKIFGGFKGNETELNQRDPLYYLTILSGEIGTSAWEDNSINVIYTKNVSAATILDGFHIIGGYACAWKSPSGSRLRSGAGWYNDGSKGRSNPTIRNCFFAKNKAIDGGAIYSNAQGGSSDLTISKCSFIQNTAFLDGGAIYYDGKKKGRFNVWLTDCVFEYNGSNNGAGIFSFNEDGNGIFRIENSKFRNNEANAKGGAVFDYSFQKNTTLFKDCVFENNLAHLTGEDVYCSRNAETEQPSKLGSRQQTYKL